MKSLTAFKNPVENLSYLKYFSIAMDEDVDPNKDTLYFVDNRYFVYNHFADDMVELEYSVGEQLKRIILVTNVTKFLHILSMLLFTCVELLDIVKSIKKARCN